MTQTKQPPENPARFMGVIQMWVLDNRTPYGAERNWVRDKQGRHFWVVAVKATYDVSEPGELTVADEQPPPALAPEYNGPPGASSLRWDSDLLYLKQCTDVIAEAHAHAPSGKPVERVEVSMRIGPIHKQLIVQGDRTYRADGRATTSPRPFVSRPIAYEWAFGGADLRTPQPTEANFYDQNPIGKGFAARRSYLAGQPALAIEYLGKPPREGAPAGLGPIDPGWSPRRERAGTFDQEWMQRRRPLLPEDYDELHGSCAPDDQRAVEPLRGGEPVELHGLTPRGILRFQLPKVYLAYTSHFGRRRKEHRGHLATVLVMPEAMQIAMVWPAAGLVDS